MTDRDIRIIAPPVYRGAYDIGGVRFTLTSQPSAIHRLFVRIVLGWKWVAR